MARNATRSAPKARKPAGEKPGKASAPDSGKGEAAKQDVVLVHGVTPDGRGLAVIRQRDDQTETGALRPLEQGKPIHGEVVTLEPRKESPLVCDVKVEVPAPAAEEPRARPSHSGPAQVASDRYRKNWDAIWKNRAKRQLPN